MSGRSRIHGVEGVEQLDVEARAGRGVLGQAPDQDTAIGSSIAGGTGHTSGSGPGRGSTTSLRGWSRTGPVLMELIDAARRTARTTGGPTIGIRSTTPAVEGLRRAVIGPPR